MQHFTTILVLYIQQFQRINIFLSSSVDNKRGKSLYCTSGRLYRL